MKKILVLISIIFLVGCGNMNNEEISNNKLNTNFEMSFLKLESNNKNIIYSPLSIKNGLYMLHDGANGNTKNEIAKLLENQSINKYSNYKKNIGFGNALFIKNGYKVKKDYINKISKKYNSSVIYDSFKNANNINKWINDKTLGLIKKPLNDRQVKNSDVILTNALGIDVKWKYKFETDNTRGSKFYVDDKEYEVTMMHQIINNEQYYKDDNIIGIKKSIESYGDNELEFIAIMPNNLNEFIKNKDIKDINHIIDNMKDMSELKEGVSLSIPKFKYDYSLDFVKDLNDLGIKQVFTPSADLSNIAADLYVSDAIHKANIEFSEDGIKASAITAFMMKYAAVLDPNEPVYLTFDKPFLYIIRDKNTKDIWFIGTVYKPNLWKNDKAIYKR